VTVAQRTNHSNNMFPEQIGLGEIAIQYVDKGVIGINRL